MSMEVTDNYGIYAANNANSTDKVDGSSRLSSNAQNYLDELKQKYPTVNITVADFGSERQKLSYMLGSSGYQNVAISGRIVEKMASDPETATKYESLIAKMPENAEETQKYADEHNINIYGSGMTIDRDGKVTYWAVGGDKEPRENPGTAYKEEVQKQLEEKRAEKKKQEEAFMEKRVVTAESQEKLLEKIGNNRKDDSETMDTKAVEYGKGTKIDFSV